MSSELQREALERAQNGTSPMNDARVIAEFTARGIPESEILPRQNVLTFHAWKALGRSVKKGEKSVRLLTFIPANEKDDPNKRPGEMSSKTLRTRPKTAFVFHVSQTETEAEARARRAEKGEAPAQAAGTVTTIEPAAAPVVSWEDTARACEESRDFLSLFS